MFSREETTRPAEGLSGGTLESYNKNWKRRLWKDGLMESVVQKVKSGSQFSGFRNPFFCYPGFLAAIERTILFLPTVEKPVYNFTFNGL